MSGLVKSSSKAKQRRNDEKSSQQSETVVAQQPGDEQLKQKEAPPASQGMIRDQGNEDKGAPVVQEPEPKADLWELAELKN